MWDIYQYFWSIRKNHAKTDPVFEYDVVIVGSGFGGSVAAMRLTQKGYRVAVLESGKRYRSDDFPKTNWNLKKYLWYPALRCFGFQKITFLKGLMLLHGRGVGGGSLVYAGTLMQPPANAFDQRGWPEDIKWEQELKPHFATAKKMLGVARNPHLFATDQAIEALGQKMGISGSFHPTEVGVCFGESSRQGIRQKPQMIADPYFSGSGPDRGACVSCGGCMVGCRYRAKNTLDYNYLYFAEKWGARVFSETEASRLVPVKTDQGTHYEIHTRSTTAWFKKRGPVFRAKRVILAAGVLGTVDLLLKNRDVYKTLPQVSSKLGETVRTNGESLLGATSFDASRDFSQGVAIGAAIHPDATTKIEGVRYPSGSGFMRLLAVPLTPDGNQWSRPLKMLLQFIRRWKSWCRLLLLRDWAKSTVILLVMQSIDQKMRLHLGRSFWTGFALGLNGQSSEKPVPAYLPVAQQAAQELAGILDGEPQNVISEVVFNMPATAHILGGCCLAPDRTQGVVNGEHEVFGHPGLYVCDGSVIPANLAINPSLTITALAERFCEFWPQHPEISENELANRKIIFS